MPKICRAQLKKKMKPKQHTTATLRKWNSVFKRQQNQILKSVRILGKII